MTALHLRGPLDGNAVTALRDEDAAVVRDGAVMYARRHAGAIVRLTLPSEALSTPSFKVDRDGNMQIGFGADSLQAAGDAGGSMPVLRTRALFAGPVGTRVGGEHDAC